MPGHTQDIAGGGSVMFEYKVIITDPSKVEEELNRLAQDGWRVVSTAINSGVVPFTRHAPLVVTLERKMNSL